MSPLWIILGLGAFWLMTRQKDVLAPAPPTAPATFTLAPGLSAKKAVASGGVLAMRALSQDPAPDMTAFKPVEWLKTRPYGPAPVGDVFMMIMDYDPELPGSFKGADITFEAYLAHFTSARPTGIQILSLSVDKAAGGEDTASYQYPDGRVRTRTRKRGEEWPSEWAGKVMWLNWHDFPGTSLESLGNLAEGIAGKDMPYMVCTARRDRTPARKQVEIIRIAKMDKQYRDVGERYILPVVSSISEYVGIIVGGSFSGIPAKVAAAASSIMANTIRYAASGNLDSWRDGMRILRRSISMKEAEDIAMRMEARLPSIGHASIASSLKAVRNASPYTHMIAARAATSLSTLYERNRRARLNNSPSQVVRAVVYV